MCVLTEWQTQGLYFVTLNRLKDKQELQEIEGKCQEDGGEPWVNGYPGYQVRTVLRGRMATLANFCL